jgi:uncharacterized membrane-anchored protein
MSRFRTAEILQVGFMCVVRREAFYWLAFWLAYILTRPLQTPSQDALAAETAA